MFREEFAVWRQDHVVVSCRYFKNRQPAAREGSPNVLLLFGISCAAEHRDVTRIGLRHIVDGLPDHTTDRSKRVGRRKGPNAPVEVRQSTTTPLSNAVHCRLSISVYERPKRRRHDG